MEIDGKKTIKMTATLTIEVPASLAVENGSDGIQTIRRCFPSVPLMRDLGEGDAVEANDILYDFFLDGSIADHSIEDLSDSDIG